MGSDEHCVALVGDGSLEMYCAGIGLLYIGGLSIGDCTGDSNDILGRFLKSRLLNGVCVNFLFLCTDCYSISPSCCFAAHSVERRT